MNISRLFALVSSVFFLTNCCHAESITYNNSQKIELSNKALAQSVAAKAIPFMTLRNLLLANQFDELESTLTKMENQFRSDASYEVALFQSYEAFTGMGNNDDGTILKAIENWVSSKNSYIAYAARGFYLSGKAGAIRGTKYANQTSQQSMESAAKVWSMSLNSFAKSIEVCH